MTIDKKLRDVLNLSDKQIKKIQLEVREERVMAEQPIPNCPDGREKGI